MVGLGCCIGSSSPLARVSTQAAVCQCRLIRLTNKPAVGLRFHLLALVAAFNWPQSSLMDGGRMEGE